MPSSYDDYEPPKVNGYYQTTTGYNYSILLPGEKKYWNKDYVEELLRDVEQNRYLGIKIAFVYYVVCFGLKHYMKDRERYNLKTLLIVWNLGLALFSIAGIVRILPEFTYTLRVHGFDYSVCDNDFTYGPGGLWWHLFFLSKIPELFDTLFIILRKRKLIFLHYYHHATVVISCWLWFHEKPSAGRWFGSMNYFVHAFMYSYYACRALHINVPGIIARVITSMQIFQMFMAVFVTFYILYLKKYYNETIGKNCATTDANLKYSMSIYLTYLILFVHFFLQAYVFKTKRRDDYKKDHAGVTVDAKVQKKVE